jgi:hypothetical protein
MHLVAEPASDDTSDWAAELETPWHSFEWLIDHPEFPVCKSVLVALEAYMKEMQ